jgi:hypothetical protein
MRGTRAKITENARLFACCPAPGAGDTPAFADCGECSLPPRSPSHGWGTAFGRYNFHPELHSPDAPLPAKAVSAEWKRRVSFS